ncbi:MAG: leucyl/phenylalanyl-tRNA--protein transferase, partial [Acidimicrobiia bacterium]|nr:leucyl/phenylalanyl-tRNA--protein transferase [Acidimicrobiia bacterium]
FDDDAPILWWSPNPRAVLLPSALRIRRSLRKTLRHGGFHCTMDEAFDAVVEGCAAPRRDGGGTWLTEEMQAAYGAAHDAGLAHSLEVWKNGTLAGGLYGMALGRCFFGESMFSTVRDASKVGLVHLCGQLAAWNFALLDCQVGNPHTEFLGARPLARDVWWSESTPVDVSSMSPGMTASFSTPRCVEAAPGTSTGWGRGGGVPSAR